MPDLAPTLYLGAFGCWLLLTVFWQFDYCRKRSKVLRAVNKLHILPIWTFFAPRPGMSDTHILYRDKLQGGDVTGWEEVTLVEERSSLHWLWNPRKRMDKVAVDALSEVKSIKNAGMEQEVDDELLEHQIKLSKGYLLLMNMVFARPKIADASSARQFSVVDATHATGERAVVPIFFSPFHSF